MHPIFHQAYDQLTSGATRVGPRDERLAAVGATTRALVVVRESNRWDLLAFGTMVLQTLLPLVHLRGVQAYLDAAGADPALVMRSSTEGERLRERFGARPLNQGKRVYGWTFAIDGTIFVFAMTSAMLSEDEDLANPFTDDLITIVRHAQLTDVFAGPETRVVRRASLGHMLGDVLERHGVRVHTKLHPDGIDIKTNGWLWTILCRQAEEDLKITLTRLLTGRILKVKRGQWDRGQGAMLVGYTVDEDGTISLGDAVQQRVARLAFERAAAAFDEVRAVQQTGVQPQITPERIVADLAVAGAVKRSNKKRDRWGNQIAGTSLVSANPKVALLTILRDIPAYATGQLVRQQGLPMTGLDERDIHGFPVFHPPGAGPEAKGFTVFSWKLPLPSGGWGSEATLVKAFRYYEWLKEHDRRSAVESEWPLSGLFTATRGDDQFRLLHASGGYQWRRYPSSKGYSKDLSVAIGKFDHSLTVTRLVDAIVAKLEVEGLAPEEIGLAGVPATPGPGIGIPVDSSGIEARRLEVESRYARARELAIEATNERARADYCGDADRLAGELDVLDRQLAELGESPVDPDNEPAAQSIEIGELATLLSVLLDTAGEPVDPAVTELLSRLITGGTLRGCWDDADPWAEFEFHLRVQTTRGWRTVGPITFELGNSSQGSDRCAWHRRMRRVAELRMAHGHEIEELAARLGAQPTPQRLFRTLTQTVAEIFGVTTNVAAAMVDHPISSTRAALWAIHHGGPLPQLDGLDPDQGGRHIEVLRDSYLAPGATWAVPAAFLGGERTRRDVARWVQAHSATDLDAGAPICALAHAMGWRCPRDAATAQARRQPKAGGSLQPALVEKWSADRRPDWGSGGSWIKDPVSGARVRAKGVSDDDKRLRIRRCPWCETRTILQPIPCLEGGDDPVLCVTCRRKPDDPSHVFPAEYLQPWEGPFGRSTTDDRKVRDAGQRAGTRLAPPPAMPTRARLRRAVATKAGKPSARARA